MHVSLFIAIQCKLDRPIEAMNSDPIIVIGGGIAGICCIQQLAEELPDKQILLITSSNLVKVTNNIERFGLNLVRFNVANQNLDQFQTNYPNVKVIIDKVVYLDSDLKQIKLLKSDECLNYDKIAICTGATPKSLDNLKTSFSKRELDQVCCVIRDTETVKDLEKKFSKSKRVAIVGNGGIATELVFSITSCSLIWIIRDHHITSTFLDAGAAHFLRSYISKDRDEMKNRKEDQLDAKMIKRLKYTIVEGEKKIEDLTSNEQNDLDYGSALGPDWQQKIELRGQFSTNSSKEISFEKNCEVDSLLRFNELDEKIKLELSDDLYRDKNVKELWPIFIRLTNGKVIGCDLLINAIGVKSNSRSFKSKTQLQLASDDGILVDKFMRTSLDDVYAAGDVCTPFTNYSNQINWLTEDIENQFRQNQIQTEHWHQIRLWTQARQMGILMANSISLNIKQENLDNLALYSSFDLFTHMTSFFGFKVILIGLFNGQYLNDDYEMLVQVEENEKYMKVVIKDGKLKGCILIGDTDLEETFENLIINQLDISNIKDNLLDNTVDLEDYFD